MNRVSCICLIVALSFVMIACHTTEENYRAAYELARGGDNEDDDEVMNQIMKNVNAPAMIDVCGETMPLRGEFVSIISEPGDEKVEIRQYNVIVGKFRQKFNARSMRQRMIDLGYTSFVMCDREPYYFVAVESTNLLEEALQLYKKVASDKRITFQSPFPWVLEPTQLIRRKNRK